ncbi:hypothetical protein Tco_0643890 [Tanacetum coccineum]
MKIRDEKIARNANPLALVAVAQQYLDIYYQAPKSHRSYAPPAKTSPLTRSHATTRNKGKEIAKPITPPSESDSEEDRPSFDAEPLEKVHSDDDYNVFANERHHFEQPVSIYNTCVVEKVDSNVIPDSSNMCDNDNQADKNVEECDDERAVLANLITNLKRDTDENKKIYKQLKKANTSLSHELQECKSALEECKSSLEKSNRPRDRYLVALHDKEVELARYKIFKDIVDLAWEKHTYDKFCAPTTEDMTVLLKTCLLPLALKTQNDSFIFVNEFKQEVFADLQYVQSLEKEIDELESDKADFSNIYDLLLQECVSKDVMCSYLHSLSDLDAYNELQFCKEKASTVFQKEREQYFEIQDLKAQLQDKNIAISELKKLIEKCKGKSVETKFDIPSVVRQPNAQRIPKPSVLGKPTPFLDSLERKFFSKTESVTKTNVLKGLSKPVTTHILPQMARQAVRNTNVIKPGMYRIDTRTTQTRAPQLPQTSRNTNPRMSTSTEVIHNTSVSRP